MIEIFCDDVWIDEEKGFLLKRNGEPLVRGDIIDIHVEKIDSKEGVFVFRIEDEVKIVVKGVEE